MTKPSESLQKLKDKKANAESGCILFAGIGALLLMLTIAVLLIAMAEVKSAAGISLVRLSLAASLILCVVLAVLAAYCRFKVYVYRRQIEQMEDGRP